MAKKNKSLSAQRLADQRADEINQATFDANESHLPQTVYRIDDADWGFCHRWFGIEPRDFIEPILSVLPAQYFN